MNLVIGGMVDVAWLNSVSHAADPAYSRRETKDHASAQIDSDEAGITAAPTESLRNPAARAATPNAADDHINAFQSGQDLVGHDAVALAVPGIVVLIRPVGMGVFPAELVQSLQPVGLSGARIRVIRNDMDFGIEIAEPLSDVIVERHLVGNEDAPIPVLLADLREPDAHRSARCLDDHPTRPQQTLAPCAPHHSERIDALHELESRSPEVGTELDHRREQRVGHVQVILASLVPTLQLRAIIVRCGPSSSSPPRPPRAPRRRLS